jgi:hypothetical protein
MKTTLAAAVLVLIFSVPALAQTGNIGGVESRGAPINSSVNSAARDRDTGLTPGGMASYGYYNNGYGWVVVKKKRPHTVVRDAPPPRRY